MKRPKITGLSTDTGASATDRITSDTTPTLSGRTKAGAKVVIRDNGEVIGKVKADGSGHWTFTTIMLAEGVHNFSAKASKKGDSSAYSKAFSTTIDTTAPAAPVISDFSGDTGTLDDGITSDTTLQVTGTAIAGVTVTIFDGVTMLGTAIANASGNWSFNTPTLAEGVHSFTATQPDLAGNTATSGGYQVTVDTTAPAAPVIDSSFGDDDGTPGDGRTTDTTLHLTGTAEPGATIQIFDGGTLIGTATADENGDWSFDTPELLLGEHSFTAKAIDAAGNTSPGSTPLPVTVDETVPLAVTGFSDDTGVSGDNLTRDVDLQLTGTGPIASTVEIFDGATSLGTAIVDGTGNWVLSAPTLAEGAHSLTVRTTSGPPESSDPVVITIDTTPPGQPTIAFTGDDTGVPGDGITSDTALDISGTAEVGATVEIFDGAQSLGTATANGSGNWTFNTGTLAEGPHNLTAKATDAAGNTGAASAPLAVTVDTVAPPAPAITGFSDDTGTPADSITADTMLHLTGTAEAGASVSVYDGGTFVGTTIADGLGSWAYDTGMLAEGAHAFTARATDAAGNFGPASAVLAVTIDTTAPPSPLITGFASDTGVPDDGNTADTILRITGTATANAFVEIFDGNTSIGNTTASGSGAWSFFTPELDDGMHFFTARSIDVAGNVSGASPALAVEVDTTPPQAPAVTTENGVVFDATPTVEGTAELGSLVALMENGVVLATGFADSVTGAWAITVPDDEELSEGIHFLTVEATDAAGNTGRSTMVALHIDPDLPPDETLTTGTDTVNASSVNSKVFGVAGTLNPDDSLDGGDGFDTLQLSGAGTFDVNIPALFVNFEKMLVTNYFSGATNLTLRDDTDIVVDLVNQSGDGGTVNLTNGTNSSATINVLGDNFDFVLGDGQATIDLSASANSSILVGADTLRLDDGFTAHQDGSAFLIEEAGIFNFTLPEFRGEWSVSLGGDAILEVNSLMIGNLSGVSGSATDTMNTVDDLLDLSDTPVTGGMFVTSSNSTGTVFTVADIDTGLHVLGGLGDDTLFAPDLTFSETQRDTIFAQGSIETITDASGTYEFGP